MGIDALRTGNTSASTHLEKQRHQRRSQFLCVMDPRKSHLFQIKDSLPPLGMLASSPSELASPFILATRCDRGGRSAFFFGF